VTHQPFGGDSTPTGDLALSVTRNLGVLTKAPFSWKLKNWLQYRRRDIPKLAATRILGTLPGILCMEGQLRGATYRADWSRLTPWESAKLRALLAQSHPVHDLPRYFGGMVTQYGVLSTRVVTNAGVAFIVDAFQNTVEVELMHFHGFGTGTNAENVTDTALQTEETTQYVSDNVRPTGTNTESAANIFQTVATYSPDSGGTRAITEHGVFSATSAGTLLDRSVFSAVNLVAGADSLQADYRLTFTAGS
jgi:hypothetical protein